MSYEGMRLAAGSGTYPAMVQTGILEVGKMEGPDDSITKLISLAGQLISLADAAHAQCRDDSCLSLFGQVKDYGYKFKAEAEREYRLHEARGDQAGDHRGNAGLDLR